jgi:hypothetical protein
MISAASNCTSPEFRIVTSNGLESLLVFAPTGVLLMLIWGLGIWVLSTWAQKRAAANMGQTVAVIGTKKLHMADYSNQKLQTSFETAQLGAENTHVL